MTLSLVLICALAIQPVFGQAPGQIPLPGRSIPKYVDPLPTFRGLRVDATQELKISMEEFQAQVLPAIYGPTTVWGYEIRNATDDLLAPRYYPAFTLEAQAGTPTVVTYANNLSNPQAPFYRAAVDQTMHWADPLNDHHLWTPPLPVPIGAGFNYSGPIPGVVHLHGGEVPSAYDGGPDAWFTSGGLTGPGYRASVGTTYEYPNDQLGATLWFHDHALGVTRLNVYAGMAGFYFLRDGFDTGQPGNAANLPTGDQEIEVVFQDRMFDTNGEFFYPVGGDNPEIHPFWQPEFFGDVIVVNGKSWPYLDVEPRRYRFRFLNGSNSRAYTMWLQNQATGTQGPAFYQIGTDGGLMEFPAAIDPKLGQKLLMAPGERGDIIIDFSGYDGQTLTLRNNARSPFPKGGTVDPRTTGQIMQFRVVLPLSGTDTSYDPATGGVIRPLTKLANFLTATPNVPFQKTRLLTLNEVMGVAGPVEALVNNTKWNGEESPNAGAFITEMPIEGETEVWKIINLTGDAHPIHLHLTQFQLVSRQKYNVNKYTKLYDGSFPAVANWFDPLTGGTVNYPGGIYVPAYGPPMQYGSTYNAATSTGYYGGNPDVTRYLQGPAKPAQPNEQGWKDTFVMYPGEVTTVIVRFAKQVDGTNFSFNPQSGPGYVWHCHILEHEDNEMMRPYSVVSALGAGDGRDAPGGVTIAAAKADLALDQFTRAEEPDALTPASFELSQNYPNPFNPSTEIRFSLPEASRVTLMVYNSLGQEVKTLIDSDAPAGYHTVKLDGRGLSSGIYYYRIQAGSFRDVKSMILMK
jgi:FtsP/CotA-like multicopper oxidase with cupredoxin domain